MFYRDASLGSKIDYYLRSKVKTTSTCNADGTTGGSYAAPNVSGTIATIAAGATRTLVFRATVN